MKAGTRLYGAVPGDWQDAAACRGKSDLFYGPEAEPSGRPHDQRVAAAKAVCRACPVAAPCLDFAIATEERHGVWAGLDASELRAARYERRLARAGR